jgi:hypothetical protein
MARYLAIARAALAQARGPADFKQRLISAFAEYSGRALLDHEMRFLFPARLSDDQHR